MLDNKNVVMDINTVAQQNNNEGNPYKNGATGGVPNDYKQTIRNRLN